MIQANELRLGNYILDYEAEPNKTPYWRVEAIHEDGIEYRNLSCWTLDGHIQPIPLTEEILLKCGFETFGEDFRLGQYTFNLKLGTFCYGLQAGCNVINEVDIVNLHQLQNLYFSLVGEELKIEL